MPATSLDSSGRRTRYFAMAPVDSILARTAMLFVACFSFGIATAQEKRNEQVAFTEVPNWIWTKQSTANQNLFLRKEFEVKGTIKQALLAATADNHCTVFINGKKVTNSDSWEELATADVTKQIKAGRNVIAVAAKNDDGIAAFLLALSLKSDSQTREIVSDASWKVGSANGESWRSVGFDDGSWESAVVVGKLGESNLPWSRSVDQEALNSSFGTTSGEFIPVVATNAQVPDGFKIEKIYHVPRSMGSWVALTVDPEGRLIASDQGGAGLFRITPGSNGKPTQVEKLPVTLSGAQGLLWAFDSLYAVVNGGDASGLHRLRDTNNDGLVDADEHCMFVPGGGEHGPHAVILSPDGKSLFVAAGNHTKLPAVISGSRIPQNWNEDHLLPRRWDANGHAAGILAPGGWVCEVDPSGKNWNVFTMGYRNQYDMAFNGDGELFVYDADMEWDFGSPWYRPTRVCHATSGSEFGWRSGTGKWPAYYEDSLPSAVDIGPGSPTGVVFGEGAKFPAKYQRSLFILDWTYSTIYAIELQPDGSSYSGKKTDFVTGSPLPVTDAIIGKDGALYFAVGGRGTQSGLYRVSYVGNESTATVKQTDSQGAELRRLRRQLEAFHGKSDGDLELMFANLGHADRFIRYAARIALENQPFPKWRDRALALTSPRAALTGLLAVARQGSAADFDSLFTSLTKISFTSLNENDQLTYLRILQVAMARHGESSAAWREKLIAVLDPLYPAKSYPLNAELVQVLVFLQAPSVIEKTFKVMDSLGPEPIPDWGYLVERNAGYGGTVGQMLKDMPPARAIHFAFVLRNVKTGWTMKQREKYFAFFIEAAKHPGGNSYGKFLMQMRDDALATCSQAERIVLEPLAGRSLLAAPVESTPPKGPGRKWTTAEALAVVSGELGKRDHASGRNLFHATSCAKCHRMAGEGGAIGPDLSTAGKKFSPTDMFDAIIDPSKAISDQYGSQQVLTTDGKLLVGRTVEIGDEYYVYTVDADAKPVVLKKSDVEQVQPSKVSQMPVGLIDGLNEDELKDLFAYIMAAGEKRASYYR